MKKNARAYHSAKQLQRQDTARLGKSSARQQQGDTTNRDLVTRYYGKYVDKI